MNQIKEEKMNHSCGGFKIVCLVIAATLLCPASVFAQGTVATPPSLSSLNASGIEPATDPVASSGSTQILSLKELIAEALENNPGLKAAQNKVEAQKSRIAQEHWALPDPRVGANVEGRPRNPANFTDFTDIDYMVEQEIPNPLKLWTRGKIAAREKDMAQASYLGRERKLIADLKSAYYDLFMIERSIEVNRENKDLVSQFLKSAESRYSVGKATQNDVLKAQVELSKLTNELVTLGQMKQTAIARLNALLNRPTRSELGTTAFKAAARTSNFEWGTLEKLTLEKNPDLLEFQAAVKKQESSLRLARFEYLPDFMVRSENRQFKGEGLREYDAFLGVTIPLWGFKKQRNQVKEAKALLEEARANYQQMKNSALFEVQDALVRVESNQRLVALYETSVLPQAQQSLKSAVAGYESDRNDFLSLIDAQRNLKTFQLEYYDSVVKLEQSFADLERAVGTNLEE